MSQEGATAPPLAASVTASEASLHAGTNGVRVSATREVTVECQDERRPGDAGLLSVGWAACYLVATPPPNPKQHNLLAQFVLLCF